MRSAASKEAGLVCLGGFGLRFVVSLTLKFSMVRLSVYRHSPRGASAVYWAQGLSRFLLGGLV